MSPAAPRPVGRSDDEDPSALPEWRKPLSAPAGGFRSGEGLFALPLAALEKRDLKKLANASANAGPAWSRMGIIPATRAEHVRWLRRIGATATQDTEFPANWPAVDFILRMVQKRATERKWRWSTTAKNLEAIAGAFSAIPSYLPKLPQPVALRESPQWVHSCRHAQTKAAGEVPTQARPITKSEALEVCRRSNRRTAGLVALSWVTTGRPGCVSQLKQQDVQRTGTTIAVTFRRGKRVRLTKRPYTVTTVLGEFAEFIEPVLDEDRGSEFLFPCGSAQDRQTMLREMVAGMKEVCPDLESRSIRRGALQRMARAGVPASVLLTFSGHGTVQMLKTYLGFGTLLEDEAAPQRAAALRALTDQHVIRFEDSQ